MENNGHDEKEVEINYTKKTQNPICIHCGGLTNKNGFITLKKSGKLQRYECLTCGRSFRETSNKSVFANTYKKIDLIKLKELLDNNLSDAEIATQLNCSPTSVMILRIKKFKLYRRPGAHFSPIQRSREILERELTHLENDLNDLSLKVKHLRKGVMTGYPSVYTNSILKKKRYNIDAEEYKKSDKNES